MQEEELWDHPTKKINKNNKWGGGGLKKKNHSHHLEHTHNDREQGRLNWACRSNIVERWVICENGTVTLVFPFHLINQDQHLVLIFCTRDGYHYSERPGGGVWGSKAGATVWKHEL